MQILPLDTPELINLAADWLNEPGNYKWLDFGSGVQRVSIASLKIMSQRDIHVLRAFTADDDKTPIGLIGLSNVDRNFKTAAIWIVLGNKHYSGKRYPARAGSWLLAFAFRELGLNAVQAWCVECNHASARLIRGLNFRPIGRQRCAHQIDGRVYDRLWFDLLSSEFKETDYD